MMKKTTVFLESLIYWSIVFIPFSIAIAPAITHSLMGLMSFAYLLKKFLQRQVPFTSTAVNMPFAALIFVSLLSFFNTINLIDSFHGIGKLLKDAFLFLICAEHIKDKSHVKRIVFSIIAGVSLSCIDAFWQLSAGRDFIRGREIIFNIGLKRTTAAFPNANIFGIYLSGMAPFVVGMTACYFRGARKIAMIFASCLAIAGIVFTFSRGTAAGFYAALLVLAVLKKKRLVVLLLVALLLIAPFLLPREIKNWAREVNYNPAVFLLNADRLSIYRNTLNMIKHHPFIGVGVNTFARNYLTYKLPEPEGAQTADKMYAHNNFLHMAGEIGIIGLGIFFWFLVRLFRQCIYNFKHIQDNLLKAASLSSMACLIGFLVNGLTETSLYYSRVAMVFWYLVGFSLSLRKFASQVCV